MYEDIDSEIDSPRRHANLIIQMENSIKTRQLVFTIIQIASTWYMLDYFLGS